MGRKGHKEMRREKEKLERSVANRYKSRGGQKPQQPHKDKSKYDRNENTIDESY